MFSRESQVDSWSSSKGGQIPKFNEQNKLVKKLFKEHPEVRLDGLYSSLVATH